PIFENLQIQPPAEWPPRPLNRFQGIRVEPAANLGSKSTHDAFSTVSMCCAVEFYLLPINCQNDQLKRRERKPCGFMADRAKLENPSLSIHSGQAITIFVRKAMNNLTGKMRGHQQQGAVFSEVSV